MDDEIKALLKKLDEIKAEIKTFSLPRRKLISLPRRKLKQSQENPENCCMKDPIWVIRNHYCPVFAMVKTLKAL